MLLDWLKVMRVTGLVTIISNLIAASATAVYTNGGLDPSWIFKRWYQVGAKNLSAIVATSCLLYLAGMLWNDLADVGRDRVLHPKRPLPSGRLSLGAAYVVGVLLLIGALACAATVDSHTFYAAGAVLSLIMLYNLVTKDVPYLGSVTMAAVRASHAIFALAILGSDYLRLAVLGHDVGIHQEVLIYPLILGSYIMGVTLISELESRPWRRFELILGGLFVFGAIAVTLGRLLTAHWFTHLVQGCHVMVYVGLLLTLGLAGWVAFRFVRRIWTPWLIALRSGRSEHAGPIVGAALGGMLFLDALIAATAHPLAGLAVIALVPLFLYGKRTVKMD